MEWSSLFLLKWFMYPENQKNYTEILLKRIQPQHLKRRLAAQVGHIVRVFGKGVGRIHFENFELLPFATKTALKLIGLYGRGYQNFRNFEVTENRVKVSNLPASFNGFKILQLSDLHLDIDPDLTDLIISQVKKLSFDLCVLTGDYRWRTYGPLVVQEMRRLSPHLQCEFGTYGILGNHDFIEMVPHFEDAGIRMLMNESVQIRKGGQAIGVAGVDDPHFYGAHDLMHARVDIQELPFKIVLVHSPELYKRAHQLGFDFYLAGHTHAGQICLPGGIAILKNAACPGHLIKGAWSYGRMQGYTSRGIGASGIPVRFFCPPEIVVHHLVTN